VSGASERRRIKRSQGKRLELHGRKCERLCRWMGFRHFDRNGSHVSAAGKLANAAIFVGRVLLIVMLGGLILMLGKLHVLHVLMRGGNTV